jgi:hypothetical protein
MELVIYTVVDFLHPLFFIYFNIIVFFLGCQCPCGSKVSPAFYLVPSKVEWSNMVQNVEVTV